MAKLFEIYKKDKAFSMEWFFQKGGYCFVSLAHFTLLHRFFKTGSYLDGTEKEFLFRAEFGIDIEPRFSFFTLEAFNLYEARVFYMVIKLWRQFNFRIVLNLGFRLTRASRDFFQKQLLEQERSAKARAFAIKNNAGGKVNGAVHRAY